MRTIKIRQVDAFTDQPFGGNPAGVVLDADGLGDALMQQIAAEINASETAFVSKSGVADFRVRFFTPRAEVDLCGHATIATFSVLFAAGRLDDQRKVFTQETGAGILPVEIVADTDSVKFMMTQSPPRHETLGAMRPEIAQALNLEESKLLEQLPAKVYTGLWWLVAGLRELQPLTDMKPDFAAITELSRRMGIAGLLCFCQETLDAAADFHIRAFCPILGVNEDPVCGTGCGCAAAYLALNGLIPAAERTSLIAEQGMEVGRPGRVHISLENKDSQVTLVKVGGTAFTVLEGELKLPGST